MSEYGTAIGVNPIMCNAPENLQNKLAMKYMQNHGPSPPFQEIFKSIHEVEVSLNGPGFPFESSPPLGMDKQIIRNTLLDFVQRTWESKPRHIPTSGHNPNTMFQLTMTHLV